MNTSAALPTKQPLPQPYLVPPLPDHMHITCTSPVLLWKPSSISRGFAGSGGSKFSIEQLPSLSGAPTANMLVDFRVPAENATVLPSLKLIGEVVLAVSNVSHSPIALWSSASAALWSARAATKFIRALLSFRRASVTSIGLPAPISYLPWASL